MAPLYTRRSVPSTALPRRSPVGLGAKTDDRRGHGGLVTAPDWRVKRRCASLCRIRLEVRVSRVRRDTPRVGRLVKRPHKQPTDRKDHMKRRHLLAAGIGALAAPAVVRADAKFPERTIRL